MPFVKKYKVPAILAPIMVVCEVFMELLIPRVMARIIDTGIPNKDTEYIVKYGLIMIFLAVFSLILGALSATFSASASTGFAKELRIGLFNKIQDLSFSNIDKFSTASLLTRLTSDVTGVQQALGMSLRMLFRAPFMMTLAIIMAVSINSELAVVFLVAVPVLAVILAIVAIKAFPRFKEMLKRKDKMNSVVQENLIGIRVVKSFVREDHENEKFQNIAYKLFESQLKAERLFIVIMPSMQFVMYACMIAISWFGGNKIITGTMKTGEFMSFISYVVQILMSLMMLSMVFVMLVTSRASISRITELLDEQPDINDKGDSSIKNVPDGSFSYDNVSFRYGGDKGNLVLENINLSVRSGETVGIIGGTGSAKSTLVQILPRLYDVSSGSVSVGGHDVRDYDLTVLRDSVAMVLQKNVLFSGTIKENLRWGGPSATDEELIEACKAAQAHDFISAFPEGYDYYVEQGGVNLSGGQKQRLCIARALLKKPKIIIMDDSTSAVDTATDSKLRAGVRKYLQNTTTVIIAQRIASVIDADKIIVMDDGKVNAVGTPDELRRTNQIYREVYESQQKGVAENGRS